LYKKQVNYCYFDAILYNDEVVQRKEKEMRRKRTEIANAEVINTLHITQRCVRQQYFLDDNRYVKGRFKQRRVAIFQRLVHLASAFAIDVLRVSFMSNHIHLNLRNRPDIVSTWSDQEVVRRWLKICPGYCQAHVDFHEYLPTPPTEEDIARELKNKKRVKELRRRLSDISTFMWSFNNYSSKLFNMMDGVRGCFWESRYKVQALLDNEALLICGLYVDLNPIRAGVANTPEESKFTSAYWQIETLKFLAKFPNADPAKRPDAFLAPVQITCDEACKTNSSTGCRASDMGFLEMSSAEYLILLDLMGRIVREDKVGSIPAELPPIFERLKIDFEAIVELVKGYEVLFKSFVGTTESIQAKTRELGAKRLHCPAITRSSV
jgi:REP element-mobilizing transposase RayT